MPGPALHHMVADRLKSRIHLGTGLGSALEPANYAALDGLLADTKNVPYLFLGSQGPDFLFFNAKDVDPTIGKLVEFYYDVYDFIERFKRTLLDAVPQPVLDALAGFDEAANEVINDSALLSELKQTFEDLNRLLTGFVATLTEMVKKFISEFNVFDLVSHPYRDGASEGDWWWFDAMHYRKTGKFATEMLEATRDMSSPLHLYALGYLTHFAADTVGHPYVNINSGGPYRSHSQRHKTGENFQDVFNFLDVKGQDWNYSKLHAFYNFNFDGTVSDTEPDSFTNLPDELAQLIADALNRVYQEDADPDADYASTITAEDVNDTYRTWYSWFKSATDTGTLPPPVTYSFTAELREVWEKTLDNLDDAGDLIESAVDSASEFGILSIFLVLAALVVAAVMAAAALADGIAGAIATVGTATIRYTACLIYEQLYNAFQNFRLGVSLNGLAFPMREHLGEPRFQQFITPAVPDSTGVTAEMIAPFLPTLRWIPSFLGDPLGVIFSRERHLVYPLTAGERTSVQAAPPSYYSRLPTHYAFGDIPLTASLLDSLTDLPTGTERSEEALNQILGKGTLGNALDLSGALYDRWFQGQPLPDFNLDADRGYGYLCWTQTLNGGPEPANVPTPLVTNQSAADPTSVRLEFIP
jgi:hypothetical protein